MLEPELGRRRTATDLAFERLRQAIINGELKPDERLTETKLAASLHISRTPLRHAFQRLETEGWVRRTSTGGIRVCGVSDLEIEGLYDVRSSLESLALGQSIAQIRESDLSNLRSNLEDQRRVLGTGDISAVADLSEAFHREIWRLSGNHVCIEFLGKIDDRTKRYRRIAFGGQSNIAQGVTEHEQILDRMAVKDADGARELLVLHIEHSRTAVKSAFRGWVNRTG